MTTSLEDDMANSRKARSTKKNTEIHELRKENAALKKEIASLKPIVIKGTQLKVIDTTPI